MGVMVFERGVASSHLEQTQDITFTEQFIQAESCTKIQEGPDKATVNQGCSPLSRQTSPHIYLAGGKGADVRVNSLTPYNIETKYPHFCACSTMFKSL